MCAINRKEHLQGNFEEQAARAYGFAGLEDRGIYMMGAVYESLIPLVIPQR